MSEIDDVPVFCQQGPAPLSAGLAFGVGRRDETFAAGGLTHLVEHLAMSTLPKRHVDRNASVSTEVTLFRVTGRPEQVVEFFAGICSALRALPLHRLETERRVLAAEVATSGTSVLGDLLRERYGATGLGLVGMREPSLSHLSGDQVIAHAGQFFHRDNAALWLTGPAPADLRLDLPHGVRPERPPQLSLPHLLPGQKRYDRPYVAMSMEAPATEALLVAAGVAQERLEDELRHRGGHSYGVEYVRLFVDTATTHLAFFADAAPREVAAVAKVMWDVLQTLGRDGPTPAELAAAVDGLRELAADPRSIETDIYEAALCSLSGQVYQSAAARLATLGAMATKDVAAAVRHWLPSLLALIPEDAPAVLPEVIDLPVFSMTRVDGKEVKPRRFCPVPRRARLVVGADGLTLRLGPGARITVRYDECVGVGVPRGDADHQHLELVGDDGLTLTLCEQDWPDGKRLLAEIGAASRNVPRFVLDDQVLTHWDD